MNVNSRKRLAKICEAVSKWFQRGILQIQRGRQLSLNRRIFEEYKLFDREAFYHLQRVQDQTNAEYDKNCRFEKSWPWVVRGESSESND